MKRAFLSTLFLLSAATLMTEAQIPPSDPQFPVRLGEKRKNLERKAGYCLSPAPKGRRLPDEYADMEAKAYRYRDTTSLRKGGALTVFLRKDRTVVALLAEYSGQAYPELLRGLYKTLGAPYARTTYKGHDFNGSGCPTQAVTVWKDEKRIVRLLIFLPEQHRCQYLAVLPSRD